MIEKWYKKEGDIIKKDEVICDIRTEVSIRLFTLFNELMNKRHSRNERATQDIGRESPVGSSEIAPFCKTSTTSALSLTDESS